MPVTHGDACQSVHPPQEGKLAMGLIIFARQAKQNNTKG
jgi:hypothetical protein